MQNVDFGRKWEDFACEYLEKQGFLILDRNFYSRYGEIDIVAKDLEGLVFVEVKARSSKKFGAPQEAVTPYKLRSIRKTADYFLLKNPKYEKLGQRIDVCAISTDYFPPKVEIIKSVC
jgi:putative endonuclease